MRGDRIANVNGLEGELRSRAARDGIQQLVVGAVVPRPGRGSGDRQILVLDRAGDDFMGGIEELPSGKVEDGEALFDALARELGEETGLVASGQPRYLFSFDYLGSSGRTSRQLNFLVLVEDGDVVVDPSGHAGFRWISLDAVAGSRLTANVIDLLARHQHLV
jgi:8-oxo-dGTP diphosphatase